MLTVLRQDDSYLLLDPSLDLSAPPDTPMGNLDDIEATSVPVILDSIVIPSPDARAMDTHTENLEATLPLSLDGMHGSPSDPGHPTCDSSEIPPGNVEDLWLQDMIHLEDIKLSAGFVTALRGATLSDPSSGLSLQGLKHL
jgi:hypothetical protein